MHQRLLMMVRHSSEQASLLLQMTGLAAWLVPCTEKRIFCEKRVFTHDPMSPAWGCSMHGQLQANWGIAFSPMTTVNRWSETCMQKAWNLRLVAALELLNHAVAVLWRCETVTHGWSGHARFNVPDVPGLRDRSAIVIGDLDELDSAVAVCLCNPHGIQAWIWAMLASFCQLWLPPHCLRCAHVAFVWRSHACCSEWQASAFVLDRLVSFHTAASPAGAVHTVLEPWVSFTRSFLVNFLFTVASEAPPSGSVLTVTGFALPGDASKQASKQVTCPPVLSHGWS